MVGVRSAVEVVMATTDTTTANHTGDGPLPPSATTANSCVPSLLNVAPGCVLCAGPGDVPRR